MTKPSAAPSMMTPSRSSRVAAAGSGGIGAGSPGGRFRGGLEGEQDRGMAGGEPPRMGEDFEAGPVAGIVAAAGEKSGERVARLRQLRRGAPERMRAHQGGRSLAERAG